MSQYFPPGDEPRPQTLPPGAREPASSGRPSGPRAGFGRRLVASLIDGFLLAIVGSVVLEALGVDVFRTRIVEGQYRAYTVDYAGGWPLLLQVANVLYYALLEGGRRGQTLGKAIMSIRVMRLWTGEPLGFWRAVGRYFARLLSAFPLFFGYLWMLWDPERQTWHDKLTGAVVVPVSAYPITPLYDDYPVQRQP